MQGEGTLLINEGLVLYVLRPDGKAKMCVSARGREWREGKRGRTSAY